ncbi:hypothetical protein L0337_45860, partial [candidate division KSB1 bacterium]|nr:hypothetical protein [candidate division KSB1 bacterium]
DLGIPESFTKDERHSQNVNESFTKDERHSQNVNESFTKRELHNRKNYTNEIEEKKYMSGKPDDAVLELDSKQATNIQMVFAHWQTVMDHPLAKLTKERRRKVQMRLKEGYTVEQLKQAIDGNKASPFHQGQNDHGTKYDDLELICRKGAQVEKFIGIAEAVKNGNGKLNANLTRRDTETHYADGREKPEHIRRFVF